MMIAKETGGQRYFDMAKEMAIMKEMTKEIAMARE